MPSRTVSDQDDVVVRVDEAGNHSPALDVDTPDVASRQGDVVTHGGEAAVLNQYLRDDAIGRVHRMDLSIDQSQIPGACRSIGRG